MSSFYASAEFCAQVDAHAERVAATLPALTPTQVAIVRGLLNPPDLPARLAQLDADREYQAARAERKRLRATAEYAAERDRLRANAHT